LQYGGGRADRCRLPPPGAEIRIVAEKAGKGRRLAAANHRQDESIRIAS